jgi:hypothetical protein
MSLPEKEKKIISEVLEKQINEAVDHEEAQMQKSWIQLACMILHQSFGFSCDDCFAFIGNWKQMYRKIGKCKTNADRDEFLKNEMEKIFGVGGYPSEWVDSLEETT